MKINIPLRPVTRAMLIVLGCLFCSVWANAQNNSLSKTAAGKPDKITRIFYGEASFYANKFHGRKMADGQLFDQAKYTAACNVLPLGSLIKVTNLKNGKTVTVKTTDRLHPKMRRLVDLSLAAAKKLGYVGRGLTRVKVELLNQKSK